LLIDILILVKKLILMQDYSVNSELIKRTILNLFGITYISHTLFDPIMLGRSIAH